MILSDENNISMAAMNYKGALLASKSEQHDEDAYEDDVCENSKKEKSQVIYKNLSFELGLCEWSYTLNTDDNIETIAIGSKWAAIATDNNNLLVFNLCGLLIRNI